MTAATALKETQTWSAEEKLDFLFGLWDQLVADGWKPTMSAELKAELDRRWRNYQANPESGLTWDQIVAHVKGDR